MAGRSSDPDAEGAVVRRRRWPWVVVSVLVVGVLWFLLAARLLVSTDEPVRSEAIVVLSGDVLGNRLRAGAEVLHETGSSRLVVFIEHGPVYDAREAAARYLADEHVNMDLVRFLPPGASTADEAATLAPMAYRCGWRTITVVTSPLHTRRAGWLVRRAVGPRVEVRVVASGEPVNTATWWTESADAEMVLLEWVKGLSSLRYFLTAPEAVDPGVTC